MASFQSVSLEAMLAAPIAVAAEYWQDLGAGGVYNTAIVDRQQPLLSLLESWLPKAPPQSLKIALDARDPKALSALSELDKMLGQASEKVLNISKQQKMAGAWGELNYSAGLAARLAEARVDKPSVALAYFLWANARRNMGDNQSVVSFYERAISAAQGPPPNQSLLSAAHDNMGNALSDLGRFDEALAHFRLSRWLETNPANAETILANEAGCQMMLGRFKAAGRTLDGLIQRLEARDASSLELATAIDMAAQSLESVGELRQALDMLKLAKAKFDPSELRHRAINALILSRALRDNKDESEAGIAFQEAHDLAIQDARNHIDAAHYERGFLSALPKAVPPTHPAYEQFLQAVLAKEHDNPAAAFASFQKAANLASTAGDIRFFLRIKANAAALLADLGQVDEAIKVASQVQSQAAASGLALPEMMALGTLASLAAGNADLSDRLGPLGPLTRSFVLREFHTKMVNRANLDAPTSMLEMMDSGAMASELASRALAHCAYKLASDYYRQAIGIAKSVNMRLETVNRLSGLLKALMKLNDGTGADEVSKEIEDHLAAGKIPLRGIIVGRRAVGSHIAKSDPSAAIREFQIANAAAEQLRQTIPVGVARAGIDRQFNDLPYRLAELLIQQNRDEEAFNVFQQSKGRRLIESLAARAGAPDGDQPLTANEAHDLLRRMSGATALVDIMVRKGAITAFVLVGGQLKTVHVEGDESLLLKVDDGDVEERKARAVSICLQNDLLRKLAETVCQNVPRGTPLMIVPDERLCNLPLHAIPFEGKTWMDYSPIGYAPTAGILRFPLSEGEQHGRSLVAGDSRRDLPGAAEECADVASTLGTQPLLGPACSRSSIEQSLRAGNPEIVHLAVHGRGDLRFGGRSSLLLTNDNGEAEWVDFNSLAAFRWTTRIVVFSGCSTGLLGRKHGYELLSVANAALEAGAQSVVASLWPVDDDYAKRFMVAFHKILRQARQAGPADLRAILNQARQDAGKPAAPHDSEIRQRDGLRHYGDLSDDDASAAAPADPAVADALRWAPFCIFGNPIVPAVS